MKIHIATVHWQSDYWIDIQLKYISQYIRGDIRTYACLNGVGQEHEIKFDWVNTDDIVDHGTKLNLMANAIMNEASNEDWVVFIDGDAFPVADVVAFAENKINTYPLIAVQRFENLGDIQPHPCFCLTTVGFWKKIKGDWRKGDYKWINSEGRHVNDVGGTLLDLLIQNNEKWLPLNRSNRIDLHPLMFGIYADMVYHHGTGFRRPASRIDKYISPNFEARKRRFEIAKRFFPSSLSKFFFSPYNKIIKTNNALNKKVLSWIDSDDKFYNRFL